jgi:hypothetical protein
MVSHLFKAQVKSKYVLKNGFKNKTPKYFSLGGVASWERRQEL